MNLAVMANARDQAEELLVAAAEIQVDAGEAETPERADRLHRIANTYVQLVRAQVERFEEAARGS